MKCLTRSLMAASVVVVGSLAATPGWAEIEYPWCSISSTGQSGIPVCLFTTREQCLASIGGMAGFCQRNSVLVWREQQQQRTPPRGAR